MRPQLINDILYEQRLAELGALTLDDSRHVADMSFFNQCMNSKVKVKLVENRVGVSDYNERRRKMQLAGTHHANCTSSGLCCYQAANTRNKLPAGCAETMTKLKATLHQHFLA